jgi:hypothetical protein
MGVLPSAWFTPAPQFYFLFRATLPPGACPTSDTNQAKQESRIKIK